MSVLDKIARLVQLAQNDDNEGRNAAWAAAKLIREHGVTMSIPPTVAESSRPTVVEPPMPDRSKSNSSRSTPVVRFDGMPVAPNRPSVSSTEFVKGVPGDNEGFVDVETILREQKQRRKSVSEK